jgi:hypothetical protein
MLDHDLELALCGRHCEHLVTTERILYPHGSEEVIGEEPLPLCSACPERENPTRPIRHIQVVLDRRGLAKPAHRRSAPYIRRQR